ncbi:hypothetical protein Pcinc_042272 [Petrolisthes cinctipes]|uniref:MADF domain-containing protein n=1 Tax=Petrolisthes cinctipes TaxID=88211 RepID=A0AAE1BHS8_PETCI|nr:hypothetical protein Pcinc_042272 [Petrolisthes cinctipes]
MLISLCELVQEHRNRYWDPKHGDYMKTKLRQHNFNSVANTLKLLYPNTGDVTGDQVRQRFKALKSYFLKEYKKQQTAPSGSEAKKEVKWDLFPHLLFVADTCNFDSHSSWSMPSQETQAVEDVVATLDVDPMDNTLLVDEDVHHILAGISSNSSSPSIRPTSPALTASSEQPTPSITAVSERSTPATADSSEHSATADGSERSATATTAGREHSAGTPKRPRGGSSSTPRKKSKTLLQSKAVDALLTLIDENQEPSGIKEAMKRTLVSFVNGCLIDIPEHEMVNFSVRAIQALKDLRDEFLR